MKRLLEQGLPDCEIAVAAAGSHFDITAIGERFAGLNAVRRQQAVYAVLGETIRSGQIHAVNIRAKTPEEG